METFAIQQKMMTKNTCYRLARRYVNNRPIGIVIHSNGVQGVPATAWPDLWNNPLALKAVHAHIDDTTIVQALPWNIQGWHAGGSANGTHLGVEMSEPIVDSEASFTATWARAIYLCVTWCKLFNLTERNIVDHHEAHGLGIASNHGDVTSDPNFNRVPAKKGQGYFPRNGRNMDAFRAAVGAALSGSTSSRGGEPSNPPPTPPPVQPPTPPAQPSQPLPRTVLRGDVGPEVRQAQTLLDTKGAALTVDGVFGPKTDAAVRDFQKKKGLTVDGIVGPKTWTALLGG